MLGRTAAEVREEALGVAAPEVRDDLMLGYNEPQVRVMQSRGDLEFREEKMLSYLSLSPT